ncbi:NACHT domain-containing protein, partial [Sinorhizobium fredii]|uniref:NACHT domain-containing protein n=1 Tax=Rhizobium fredii TaxID=380 RepID=UPI0006850168
MDYGYVSLQRRFIDIGTSDPDDDRLAAFRSLRGRPAGKTWDEIEENDGSIILGSAGSGKTTEVLEVAKRLRKSGVPAFVLRLEALCRQPVRQSFSPLDPDGEMAFNRWRGSNKPAVVFLDALDEARLPEALNGSVLNDAFGQLWDVVGSSGRELKMVITTRASEWHGPSDFKIVSQFLKKLRANPNEKYEPKAAVYRLASLQQTDIELLAASRLQSTGDFLKAVAKARAGSLASQPFEVHILIDTWLYELSRGIAPDQVFASRLALFETAISTRLQTEQGQERRSNLDPTGAREACEKLAAATVLTGIRDLSSRPGVPLAVDALAVLANGVEPWNEIDVRQLLSSALFQPSVGGKIRFAHRELQDFLAAKFFDRQMRDNAGALEIIAPLFAESHGSIFVPQDTEHVIGWLATLNRGARTKITSVRPSLLIEAGDPLLLSDEERGAALEAHVALYSDRRYRGEWFSAEDITKFATPELAPTVAKLLDHSTSPEVREFLVEVARYGKMGSLADNLASIAKNESESLRVRAEACLALKEFGDSVHMDEVFLASLYASRPDDIHAAPNWNLFQVSALQYAFPNSATILDAITAIARLRREASNYSSTSSILLEEFGSAIPENETDNWLRILLRFAAGARQEAQYRLPAVVPQFRLLRGLILSLVIRLLRQPDWQYHQEALLDALEYLFNRSDDFSLGRSTYDELLDSIVPNTELKRALISRRLQSFAVPAEKPLRLFAVIEGIKLGDNQSKRSVFSIADVASYSADVESLQSSHDRRVAFEIAENIVHRLPWVENRKGIQILAKAVRKSRDAELRVRMSSGASGIRLT